MILERVNLKSGGNLIDLLKKLEKDIVLFSNDLDLLSKIFYDISNYIWDKGRYGRYVWEELYKIEIPRDYRAVKNKYKYFYSTSVRHLEKYDKILNIIGMIYSKMGKILETSVETLLNKFYFGLGDPKEKKMLRRELYLDMSAFYKSLQNISRKISRKIADMVDAKEGRETYVKDLETYLESSKKLINSVQSSYSSIFTYLSAIWSSDLEKILYKHAYETISKNINTYYSLFDEFEWPFNPLEEFERISEKVNSLGKENTVSVFLEKFKLQTEILREFQSFLHYLIEFIRLYRENFSTYS